MDPTYRRDPGQGDGRRISLFVLGPVRVSVDGVDLSLAGTKERTVLVSLLLHENRMVSDHRLVHLLWDLNPPATSAAQIHTYISRLRAKLAPATRIVRQHHGYLLCAQDAWADFREFSTLTALGQQDLAEARYERAATRFRAALARWRGPALPDVTAFLADEVVPVWDEVRLAAMEGRISADLQLGRHARLVPELTGLVREHPYREVFRAQLMTALHSCNRQVDALAVYRDGRRILAEEMGVDPGEFLTRTHLAVLRA